jgi:endonuclease/exonuclease/phosphatase family metal-dependent hydrolase
MFNSHFCRIKMIHIKMLIHIVSKVHFSRYGILMMIALCCVHCEPFSQSNADTAYRFKATTIIPVTPEIQENHLQLKVMDWNIKYGALRIPFWFDCWGDRLHMSHEEVSSNMNSIYAMIKEGNPDVLLVQEIELHSQRSAYYDMVNGVLENTDLNYAAYFPVWDSRYVPAEGLGRMNLGNAIFSRYPITKATLTPQAQRSDIDTLTQTFYIQRGIGKAEIKVDQKSIAVYVVHTEAYDVDGTKEKQIKQIYQMVSQEALPFLLGGDFNELPPNAVRVADFPDERKKSICSDDFKQPPYTPSLMKPFYQDFIPAITLERYGDTYSSQSRFYTHSVLGDEEVNESGIIGDWNRTLDHLFLDPNSRWLDGSTDVLQRKGQKVGDTWQPLQWTLQHHPLTLSDHAPLFGIWEVEL